MAVTQALPQSLGDRRHADRVPVTTSSLAQTAQPNNWSETHEPTTYISPDGHCRLTEQPDDDLR